MQDAATATEQRNARSRKQKLLVHLAPVPLDEALAQACLALRPEQALALAGEPELPDAQQALMEQVPQMRALVSAQVPGSGQQEALPPASDPEG